MKRLSLACAAALVCAAAFARPAAVRAAKFSSAYTDLKTQCEEVSDEEPRCDDTPLRCAGVGGY